MSESALEKSVRHLRELRELRGRSGEREPSMLVDRYGFAEPATVHELGIEDFRIVAERHHALGEAEGLAEGRKEGLELGEAAGGRAARAESRELLLCVAAAVAGRLDDMAEALGVQEGAAGGKDRRTLAGLREEAVGGLTSLQAELAVVAAKIADGSF